MIAGGRRAAVRRLAPGLAMLLAVVLVPGPVQAARSGDLDRSFSRDGKVRTQLCSPGGFSVAVDDKGRAVVAGTNGGLDRSFGRNGAVRLGGFTNVWSAAIDSRDRIVVGAANASAKLVRVIGYRKHR